MVNFKRIGALLLLSHLGQLSHGKPYDEKIPASLNDKGIPWRQLSDRLSQTASLIEGSNEAFVNQCDPGFDITPSGLCLNSFACAFLDCLPNRNKTASVNENIIQLYSSTREDVETWKDLSNPAFALPASVLFPKTAGDIVAAVEFANDYRLELSIKSSGHNYSGQSSKKDTLLINTVQYRKYAATGIVECDADATSTIQTDLGNQPCVLALARKKEAYIRVATGEPWIDVYKAVHDFNEAQVDYKYHVVGGAHSSVTPMGWTFQGGMAATTMGRYLGYGVDQVLMIEAVLPTGEHVRFGPTSFEDAEGFLVPRTTAVSGVCNHNPFDDEEEAWSWGPCEKKIDFNDLWFAFRGGGGGTYGIATSIYLQLHDYEPIEYLFWNARDAFQAPIKCIPEEDYNNGIERVYSEFMLDFMLEPSKVGVSEEESSVCGSPQLNPTLMCFGNGSATRYTTAWSEYMRNNTKELLAKGVSESSIQAAAECFDGRILKSKDYFEYYTAAEASNVTPKPSAFPNSEDFGSSVSMGKSFPTNILIPMSVYQREVWIDLYQSMHSYAFYNVVGGIGVNRAHDQTTALPKSFRHAAFYAALDLPYYTGEMIRDGFIAPNHMHPHTYGSLKSNSSLPCDLDNFTFDEAEEKCYSAQEGIWGKQVLKRLEKIKKTVDPNHILNCYKCVGYKNGAAAKNDKKSKKKTKKGKSLA